MSQFIVKEIMPGSFFTKPVYLDDTFILTAPEVQFSPALIKTLAKWEFREVRSDGESREEYAGEEDAVQEEGTTEKSMLNDGNQIQETEKSVLNDGNQIWEAEKFYNGFLKYTETLYTMAAVRKKLYFDDIAEQVKTICEMSRKQRRFLLRIMKSEMPVETNYLASHALKSTIIAITIGYYIKLPPHRMIELGVAALLHEIGMAALPPQYYMTKQALSPEERKAILKHPVLSFTMLKNYDFPLAVSLATLEHHERENGTGYPQKLTGNKISLYAKIIAVACSYEALSTKRPYKEAKDGYTGMLELLKNGGKQYDDTVIKAIVFSLSIYPIGLYVLLSNGKKGQVIDVNPENPRYPEVLIFGEHTLDGKNKVLETSPNTVFITRPLRREEIGTA